VPVVGGTRTVTSKEDLPHRIVDTFNRWKPVLHGTEATPRVENVTVIAREEFIKVSLLWMESVDHGFLRKVLANSRFLDIFN